MLIRWKHDNLSITFNSTVTPRTKLYLVTSPSLQAPKILPEAAQNFLPLHGIIFSGNALLKVTILDRICFNPSQITTLEEIV
jgi:hypothetical protein